MLMGKQHRIRGRQGLAEGHEPLEVADVAAEERVGQEADAVELDQRRRVPHIEDRGHASA